ncbi:MAG: hypothetical protein KA270_00210 [Saprospiraceae bacterium]|nr:hypothetical protein [Saprospiraceae bacterium]MBP6565551.1 hypothetical protein [Saprospiraceae bacterium]
MSKLEKILHYFPETELPVLISEDHLSEFEINSDPFPQVFIDEVLLDWEKDADEFTEFIPCFRLPKEEKFNAVVYWKGALLKYDFVLVTLDKNGELINKKSIASTIVNDNVIKKSVASIEPDLIINIVAGQTLDGEEYDASMSKAFAMEILPTGEIIFAMDSLN